MLCFWARPLHRWCHSPYYFPISLSSLTAHVCQDCCLCRQAQGSALLHMLFFLDYSFFLVLCLVKPYSSCTSQCCWGYLLCWASLGSQCRPGSYPSASPFYVCTFILTITMWWCSNGLCASTKLSSMRARKYFIFLYIIQNLMWSLAQSRCSKVFTPLPATVLYQRNAFSIQKQESKHMLTSSMHFRHRQSLRLPITTNLLLLYTQS